MELQTIFNYLEHILILDSLAYPDSFFNLNPCQPLITRIVPTVFIWSPGNKGILSSEKIDELAKHRMCFPSTAHTSLSFSIDLFHYINHFLCQSCSLYKNVAVIQINFLNSKLAQFPGPLPINSLVGKKSSWLASKLYALILLARNSFLSKCLSLAHIAV